MDKKDIGKLLLIALAIVAILVIILVSATILAPAKRSSKAATVDLDCVTQPGANPLEECKQSKQYELECGPQYVKLPKEKCEIKEEE